MNAHLLGIGLATPAASAHQAQTARMAAESTLIDKDQWALVGGLYKRAGVRTRASVLLCGTTPPHEPLHQEFFPALPSAVTHDSRWPGTARRMAAFDEHAGPLALAAACRALEVAGARSHDITHLLTVSCTGLQAPGVDVHLMRKLGLHPAVQRLNLGFMGCHGGIVGLRTASALVRASPVPACALLVCVELCSLHLQRTTQVDQHVANALFADGAAAALLSNRADIQSNCDRREIVSAASTLFEESTGAMSWRIGDHGFEMTLDRSVPARIEAHLGAWVWPWLRRELGQRVTPRDVQWAVHPGGPRILDAVQTALGIDPAALDDSRSVLSDHGNMSSATVLFILQRTGAPAPDTRPTVALAFGPGLTAEGVLLANVSTQRRPSPGVLAPSPPGP